MIENNYPRILIFGLSFNNSTGGGITLSNLFKGWPKDKIAVAATGDGLFNVTTDICNTYYQLGKEEHKWVFPFNFIQKSYPSGLRLINSEKEVQINSKKGIRHYLVNKLFYPLLRNIGIYHCVSKFVLLQTLKDWLANYQPEFIYFLVSSRESILFALALRYYLQIPAAIHMMDDWPTTISTKGLFRDYWKKQIEQEFRSLLDSMTLHLSISTAMAEEYELRYNKKFIAFHNPIEIKNWLPYRKTKFDINVEYVKVLYSGRIGIGIKESLFEFARAIDKINNDTIKIRLHIQSPGIDKDILERLEKYDCVIINPIVEYSNLPKILSHADILLIANDFDKQGRDFLKFSMPTKASEYMISGTPILVYSPKESVVSNFFTQNECGYCIENQSIESIRSAIYFLIYDCEFREKISRNAIRIAKLRFNADDVRKEFRELIFNCYLKSKTSKLN